MGRDQAKSKAKSKKITKRASLMLFILITALVLAGVLLYTALSSNSTSSTPKTQKTPKAASENNSQSPSIYLSPKNGTFNQGSTISLEVRENSGNAPVNAVQANFDYPADKLNLVSIDTANSAFTAQAQNIGGNGQVRLARGIVGSLTGDQLIAKLNFSVNSAPGVVSLTFTNGTALVTSTTNTNLITSLSMTGSATYGIK